MNEFTKEELKYLHETLHWIVQDFSEPDSTYQLRGKIESLIDNYCEHACEHELQLCRCFCGVDEHAYRCKKCLKSHQEIVNDNQ